MPLTHWLRGLCVLVFKTCSHPRHVYNTTVSTACLPHTGFAGAWTPATHAEFLCGRARHIHGSRRAERAHQCGLAPNTAVYTALITSGCGNQVGQEAHHGGDLPAGSLPRNAFAPEKRFRSRETPPFPAVLLPSCRRLTPFRVAPQLLFCQKAGAFPLQLHRCSVRD